MEECEYSVGRAEFIDIAEFPKASASVITCFKHMAFIEPSLTTPPVEMICSV